jgi:hypothetical protein
VTGTTLPYLYLFVSLITSVAATDNSTGRVIICYIIQRIIIFPCSLPYFFPVIHIIESYFEADV